MQFISQNPQGKGSLSSMQHLCYSTSTANGIHGVLDVSGMTVHITDLIHTQTPSMY